MTTLIDWAVEWNVPEKAIADLIARLKNDTHDIVCENESARSEQYVQQSVRLEASEKGGRLWRNNVGAFLAANGAQVRYGLCNDSKRLNEKIKSSDLIGIRPVLVHPHHVGHTFGLFIARETKHADWIFKGTPRERAQLKFIELVLALGGDAAFATSTGTI